MISNYTKVFSISIYHTYFNNQINTLILNPNEETKRLIHSYGLKLMKSENSFQFYDQSDNGFNQLLEHIKQANNIDAFKFDIISSDSNFYNYTELPIGFNGIVLFSSSNSETLNENDTIVLQPQFIENFNPQKIGEVHLKFSDLISENPISYEIKFKARSTYWQYYIFNRSEIKTENLHIDSHSNIEFSIPKKALLNDNEAQVLTSKTLIPLHKTQTQKFDLINNENEQKLLFTGLPTPNPNQIKISKNNGETTIYSPIYIYL